MAEADTALSEYFGRFGVYHIALVVDNFTDAHLRDLNATSKTGAGVAVECARLANAVPSSFEESIFFGMKTEAG